MAAKPARSAMRRRTPRAELNTLEGSRSNIHRHYDLSNELFALFLDESMSYSSAWFQGNRATSLRDAQTAKLDRALQECGIGAGDRLTRQGGAAGSFWTGVLAAVVATPCTGPFMAAAIGAALLLPAAQALLIFAGLGLGLALPFLAIAYIPALRARMPRPGPWMVTFRKWMALPMALTALALVWLLGQLVGGARWVLGAIAAAAMLLGIIIIKRQQAPVSLILGLGSTLMIMGFLALDRLPNAAVAQPSVAELGGEAFSEEKLAQLRKGGKPVFLYFTADWCVTCTGFWSLR